MQSGINLTCLWLNLKQEIYIAARSLCAFAANGVFVSAAEYSLSQQQLLGRFSGDGAGQYLHLYFSKYFNEIMFIVCSHFEAGVNISLG